MTATIIPFPSRIPRLPDNSPLANALHDVVPMHVRACGAQAAVRRLREFLLYLELEILNFVTHPDYEIQDVTLEQAQQIARWIRHKIGELQLDTREEESA